MTIRLSTPSQQGVEPSTLLRFLDALDADERIEPHGLIVQRHGHRVLETYWRPHRAGQARLVYSLSKSFTGAALGLAVGDGLLSLDDPVIDHLGDLLADADPRTRRIRVRHLASMATGHHDDTILDVLVADPEDPVRGFFSIAPDHEPGSWFAYNQPPVLALSTLLSRLTGERLLDQLRPRLLDPLGIDNIRWHQLRPGIDLGFSGVFTDLDAVARLGQLHLDDGVWDGQRVLPAGWVTEASRRQIGNEQRPEPDWSRGYGIQLWMCRNGYRGDGAFGQYMVILPEQDTVIAFFSHTEPMQAFMDLIWDVLLPGLLPGMHPDPAGDDAVAERASGLELPTAASRSGWSNHVAPVAEGRFSRAPAGAGHPSITAVEVVDDHLLLHEDDVVTRIPVTSTWTDVAGAPMSASAAVGPDGQLAIDVAMLATPHRLEITTDPETGTFTATWPLFPLFGAGLDPVIARMRPPED